MGVHLQNLDLLTAASKQRTIEKCRLTYGSEITIIISVNARRSLDQIFPSLALDPSRRWRLGRHCLSAFDAQPSGEFLSREFPRFSAFVLALARILPHGWFSGPLEFVASLDGR